MARNNRKIELKGKDILGKKALVLGEVGAGKTTLAARLLQELMTLVRPEKITVIDFAPEKTGEVGGKLRDYADITGGVKYLSPKNVYTPRIAGKSPEQVLHYAELNKKNMEPLLDCFIKNATEVLVLNDVTLYLHLGELENILKCVRLAETFLATAYYGSRLVDDFRTGVSSREKRMVDKLSTFMDLIVKIDPFRKSVEVHAVSPHKSDQG